MSTGQQLSWPCPACFSQSDIHRPGIFAKQLLVCNKGSQLLTSFPCPFIQRTNGRDPSCPVTLAMLDEYERWEKRFKMVSGVTAGQHLQNRSSSTWIIWIIIMSYDQTMSSPVPSASCKCIKLSPAAVSPPLHAQEYHDRVDSRGQLDLDDLPEGSALETCFAIVSVQKTNASGCAHVAWSKWQQMEDVQLGDSPSRGCCLQAPKQPLPSLLTLPPHCLTCHHCHHLLWACAAGQAEDR